MNRTKSLKKRSTISEKEDFEDEVVPEWEEETQDAEETILAEETQTQVVPETQLEEEVIPETQTLNVANIIVIDD